MQGNWQTSDPLGYPDGWNNFAYCNNGVANKVDVYGLDAIDDLIASCVQSLVDSARQEIIDSCIAQALGSRTVNTDVILSLSGANVSGLTITYDYTDAYTLWLIPIGSGTGTYDASGMLTSAGDFSHTYTRTEPDVYTKLNSTSGISLTNGSYTTSSSYAINQDVSSWLSFSSARITNIHISGTVTFSSASLVLKHYVE